MHYLLYIALVLIFAYVDSQKADKKRNNNVDGYLCVMIKKNVHGEIPLFE